MTFFFDILFKKLKKETLIGIAARIPALIRGRYYARRYGRH